MQTREDRKQNKGYQALGEQENEQLLPNGYRVSMWSQENFWNYDDACN